ncbi:hypothetical protein [Cuneatibacter caecimuris]|uniref:Uncharacterized protein n=1 Tax=Cuneatibacter caecimuris TaxID=1796618 RepID=A0A4Q7PT95_9FIRM|nr:hypothetical protein [Cuneatibacter caecimuris]RZT02520.1 hypothetical protein EV209_0639 [Cuneatibacter caecimuris]
MINFEEELAKFTPSLEIDEAEDSIKDEDLTDVTDIMVELLEEVRSRN